MLHVRGSGNDVLSTMFQIADAVDCRVIDMSSGDFLSHGDPSVGMPSRASGTASSMATVRKTTVQWLFTGGLEMSLLTQFLTGYA